MNETWDGEERRSSVDPTAVIEEAVTKVANRQPAPDPGLFVKEAIWRAACLAMSFLSVVLLVIVSARVGAERARQGAFREAVSCFVVETFRPGAAAPVTEEQRTRVLEKCRFITTTPGNQ
jgi:hypothetical protein